MRCPRGRIQLKPPLQPPRYLSDLGTDRHTPPGISVTLRVTDLQSSMCKRNTDIHSSPSIGLHFQGVTPELLLHSLLPHPRMSTGDPSLRASERLEHSFCWLGEVASHCHSSTQCEEISHQRSRLSTTPNTPPIIYSSCSECKKMHRRTN